jgi:nitroreductase
MDVIECIRKRRSVRKYKSDAIPAAVLREMLEVMRLAPSAANRQPWKFLVVQDKEKRQQMVEICGGQKFLSEAPVVIIGCGYPDSAWHGMGGDKSASSVDVDLAIALDHLTLAAASRGLGTCWVGAFRESCLKQLFGIPEEVKIVALTPLGYPAEENAFHEIDASRRKPLEAIVCYERFS